MQKNIKYLPFAIIFILFQCYWVYYVFVRVNIENHILQEELTTSSTSFLGVFTGEEQDVLNYISEHQLTETNLVDKITFDGMPLLKNKVNSEYFISVGQSYSGNFSMEQGMDLLWIGDRKQDFQSFQDKISENESFSLLIVGGRYYDIISMRLTTLPILEIDADEIPYEKDDVKIEATVSIYDPNNNGSQQDSFSILYKVRGNASTGFPKKSFKMELVTVEGRRLGASLFGLRKDDDWNLTSNYSDLTKMKEMTVLSLYQELANITENSYLHPQNGVYCELFINGIYWELYQLTEPIDARQVNLQEESDLLYKATDWDFPTIEDLEEHQQHGTENAFIELKNVPDSMSDTPYSPLIDYISLLNDPNISYDQVKEKVDIENFIDLYILRMVLALEDNDLKNMVYVARKQDDGYKISIDILILIILWEKLGHVHNGI